MPEQVTMQETCAPTPMPNLALSADQAEQRILTEQWFGDAYSQPTIFASG